MQTQTTQPQVVTEVPESGWEISSGINKPTLEIQLDNQVKLYIKFYVISSQVMIYSLNFYLVSEECRTEEMFIHLTFSILMPSPIHRDFT